MPLAKKSHDVVTLLAATTTPGGVLDETSSPVRLPGMVNAVAFVLDVTAAATDGADTLDVTIQTKIDGTNWVDVAYFTRLLGNGGTKRYVAKIEAGTAQAEFENGTALLAGNVRNLIGDEWRVRYAQDDGATDASFTFSVTACPM